MLDSLLALGPVGLVLVIVGVGVQVVHNWTNRNRWPFVAQNMFAHRSPDPVRRVVVVLRDSRGGEVTVLPGRVLPVAFFRAQRMLFHVFVQCPDEETRVTFARSLLARLHEHPWRAFDEIEASVRAPAGTRFVSMALQLCELTLDEPMARDLESAIVRRQTFFRLHVGSISPEEQVVA